MQSEKPTLASFARALCANWLIAMSGPPSVPFAVMAVFLDPIWAKVVFGLLAVWCFGFSAFYLWKKERERVIVLEGRANHVEILREINDLRNVEVGLRNIPPTPVSWGKWKGEFEAIREKIGKRIETSPWSAEAGVFLTLGNKRYEWPGINDEHTMCAGILTRDIDWLEDFIKRHSPELVK